MALSDARTHAYASTGTTTLVSLAVEDGDLMAVAMDMPISLPITVRDRLTCWQGRRSARSGRRCS